MSMVTISCPSCGLSRQMPADKVPEGARQVTCPQCKSVFTFSKSPAPVPPQASAQPQAPAPPQDSLPFKGRVGVGMGSQAQQESQSQPQAPLQPQAPVGTESQAPAPPQDSLPFKGRVGVGMEPQSPVPPKPPLPPRPPVSGSPQGRPGTPRPPRPRPVAPKGLSDVGDLFKESWEIFQRRFATLIGLFLLSIIAFFLPAGAAVGLAMAAGMALGKVAIVLIGLLGMVASIYLGFRCFAGFLHAVIDEGLGLKDALAKGDGLVLALIWVGFLTGFIIGGGYMLLLIPGIIFSVWFCFTQFILVQEEVHGIDALLKSREYVRGEWFNVALRLLLVWAASLLIGAIPMAGPILGLAFFPYLMIFHYLIYRDLREMKGDVPYPCGIGDQFKWPGVALLGYVVVPAALISMVGLTMLGPLAQMVSREGITIKSAPSGELSETNNEGFRVITFPNQPQGSAPAEGEPAGSTAPSAQPAPTESQPSFPGGKEERPDNLSVFIYAVNYTGTVKANGVTMQEMEGKPETQYNYNLFGDKLRYGQNLIEVDYAELPSHSDLLKIKIRISRDNSVLKEWEFKDKGRGSTSFVVDIPK